MKHPNCNSNKQKLCTFDCESCFFGSFASCPRSNFWSNKNEKTPREYRRKSHKKFWFDCDVCNHDFESALANIVALNRWCPYCSHQKLCSNEFCSDCFNNSFASSGEKVAYWSIKNIKKPREVFISSEIKYIFDCTTCKLDFEMTPCNITHGNQWCPTCDRKTEKTLKEWLEKTFGKVKYQPRFKWCKNILTKRTLPFDFCIEKFKIIIELDGRQHFMQVWNWATPKDQRKRDLYKELMATANGYSVIRISQEDVLHNRINWKNILSRSLKRKRYVPVVTTLYNGIEIDTTYILELCFNNED